MIYYARIHSIIQNSQTVQAPQVPIDEFISKMYIHTREYYSALKRTEILTHTALWINLEDVMLSEISQSQKNKPAML